MRVALKTEISNRIPKSSGPQEGAREVCTRTDIVSEATSAKLKGPHYLYATTKLKALHDSSIILPTTHHPQFLQSMIGSGNRILES